MKNFIVRTITGVFFVAAIVLCFLNPLAMVFLFLLITTMTMWEYTGLVNGIEGVQVNRFISSAAAAFLFLGMMAYTMGITSRSGMPAATSFLPYLVTIIYLFVSELYTGNKNAINDWAYTMLGQMYIALPFSMINLLAFQNVGNATTFNNILPLSVFIFLWANDTGAYLSGSLFGKHKLFPRISPGKSWEGSIGGGILVMIVAAVIGWLTFNFQADINANAADSQMTHIITWVGMGLVVVFFGTWGDLIESLFKRTIGIKDSGNILPGHGGMLDRFDSSLMAIPACAVYIYAVQYLIAA